MSKKFIIHVDDPWEFPYNTRIEGRIVSVVSPHTLIFQSDEPMEFENHKGDIFILGTRYSVGWNFESKGEIATVGGAFYLGGDYTKESPDSMKKNSVYVLIGRLCRL